MKIEKGMLVKFKNDIDDKFIDVHLAGKIAEVINTDTLECDNALEVRLIDLPKSSTIIYKLGAFDCVIPTFNIKKCN